MTQYLVYDVFTQSRFGGNPLAVVLGAENIPEENLLKIAGEFNLPETTFVYAPENPEHTARVRIFTPAVELPFAGHPTVGTALALRDIGRATDRLVLELDVGPIPVEISGDKARFETRVPLETSQPFAKDRMAEMINLAPGAITDRAHAPLNASVGVEFRIAELEDMDALGAADPNIQLFREEIAAQNMRMGCFVYVRRGQTIHARMFAPTKGIMEDPATGSAAAALVAHLGKLDNQSQEFSIHQGIEMGRPSLIEASVTVENGQSVAVNIGGSAVQVLKGEILP